MRKDKITVCICTYRRMHLLPRLFDKLAAQKTDGEFDFSVVVVDNDRDASARKTVEGLSGRFSLKTAYDIEPERNFGLVRNRAVRLAEGDHIAFIDDDEIPFEDWLFQLRRVVNQYQADGVLGPVKPYFEQTPQKWLVKSKLCERPSYNTGKVMRWQETRSGNTLLRRSIFAEHNIWFDHSFASGGEDKDFFKRAENAGFKFTWCEEAVVHELVPPERQLKSYYLKRALLQGVISHKYELNERNIAGSFRLATKSLVGAAAYTLLMPVFFFGGMHIFMKYMVKDCHHISRLMAMIGVPLIEKRDF